MSTYLAKITFSDFIDHFSGMDDKQIVKDVRKSIEDLAEGNSRGKSFGAFIVKSTKERIAKVRKKKVEAGRKGGLANIAKYHKIKELTSQNNYQVTTTHATTHTISTDNVEPDNVKLDIGKLSQDAPNGNAGVDMSDAGNGAASKSPTSCDTLTADGDTREDSQAKPDGSAITRYETRNIDALEPSANHYATRQAKNGDAATREGADVSTTVSRNMRQPAKTRDTSESCRYAPPSCSPEDGNHYDQDAPTSTDDPQPEGLTGPSHGGSVASLEARESQARKSQWRTGGSSVRGMAKVAQPPVRSFGEYGLVHMTDAQANRLRSYYGEDFDRAVGILENYILSLPSKAEGDEKGEAKLWREDYAKRNHYFAMRRDNWVDNALKKAKTADKRLENASNPNYKSFKQQDLDARTEFFSKSIFDGKEAI